MVNAIVIDPVDNVATLLTDVAPETDVSWATDARVTAHESVAAGHKIAVVDISTGDDVLKYGHPIGAANRDISAGEHVHVHNLADAEG